MANNDTVKMLSGKGKLSISQYSSSSNMSGQVNNRQNRQQSNQSKAQNHSKKWSPSAPYSKFILYSKFCKFYNKDGKCNNEYDASSRMCSIAGRDIYFTLLLRKGTSFFMTHI